MYRSVTSGVHVHNRVTEFVYCRFDVKQECILSPALFSLFVNEIAIRKEAVGKHVTQLQPVLAKKIVAVC